jgi:lipopolysaccharide transport system ATP-binding protein
LPRVSDAQPAVSFDAVWKKFRRGERHDSLRDLVPALIKRGFRADASALDAEEFWAVEDVSFETRPGEALAIIGPNGAGKSTILKLLTKILRPTKGRAALRGRVGALIEVAAGFHPDLTGRENVYLQGAIMHMKRAEIARKFDDIVDFAGLAPFIDTPVKRYSSGMNARLGFSIAAHLDPDVLLIDEVLAVGDMAFQQRCIERMHGFKRQGVAIVFVSHNLQAVANLCERAIYLQRSVRAQGPTLGVIEQYVRATDRLQAATGSGAVDIVGGELFDENGDPASVVEPGRSMLLRVTYRAHASVSDLLFGFLAYRSTDSLLVYDANFSSRDLALAPLRPGEQFSVDFRFRAHLTRGQYHLACHVFDTSTQEYTSRMSPVGIFTVREDRTFAGIADLQVASSLGPGRSREAVAAGANEL